MDKILAKSPAKINFGLNVISKRTDGFHNLETIFYPLKLSDVLFFEKSDKFYFKSNNSELNTEKSNLVTKAKELIENEIKCKLNCNIYLEKIIPIGAGLGGGSSNAANTLISLNKLFELNLSPNKLSELALLLGSDVPFFINPKPSFANSRGEILSKLNFSLNGYILIVNPKIHISTKWAFSNLKNFSTAGLLDKNIKIINTGKDYCRLITNDFEEIVFNEYPEIKTIKEKLYNSGAFFSLMTGTGSTVFGIYNSLEDAESAKNIFPREYFTYIEKL